jgi:ferrous iron transport protein B
MKLNTTKIQPPILIKKTKRVVILGNPNSGKTALFNQLTGLHQKTANYPGVTVEKKEGKIKGGHIIIEDLPGAYSLIPQSEDEKIVFNIVQSWRDPDQRPDAVVVVVDLTNLEKNIYLALQILDWGLPTLLVFNMIDVARKKGYFLDLNLLRMRLNANAIVATSAKTGEGINEVKSIIVRLVESKKTNAQNPILIKVDDRLRPLKDLLQLLQNVREQLNFSPLIDSLRLVSSDIHVESLRKLLNVQQITEIENEIERAREILHYQGIHYQSLEATLRHEFIENDLIPILQENEESNISVSERIDHILTHPVAGIVIFMVVMGFIFNSIFSWAEYPMDKIQEGISWTGSILTKWIPESTFKDLIIDGIIGGVGNVVIFLPQIILLILFLGILEDSGYMARMSFLMDNIMNRVGLHGKSVLPLLSGFACAIPAILATRTIENRRDRLIVILLIPLMSCSARLPVYTLLISAFVPHRLLFGFLQLQGLVLITIYFLGLVTALCIAFIIK